MAVNPCDPMRILWLSSFSVESIKRVSSISSIRTQARNSLVISTGLLADIDTHSPMAVPVATPHSAASLTHQRRGEASIVSRMPNASGKNLVHGSDAAVIS